MPCRGFLLASPFMDASILTGTLTVAAVIVGPLGT